MNCKSTVEMLSAYLDRELGVQERDAVRAHLADCDRCRSEERDLRALKGLLLGVRAPEPAEDFEMRLMSRLREESLTPMRRPFAFPKLRPLALGQWGGLAAAATLGAFVILQGPRPMSAPAPAKRTNETVAQNDYSVYAERYDAYYGGDDFTAGSSLLTPTSYGP